MIYRRVSFSVRVGTLYKSELCPERTEWTFPKRTDWTLPRVNRVNFVPSEQSELFPERTEWTFPRANRVNFVPSEQSELCPERTEWTLSRANRVNFVPSEQSELCPERTKWTLRDMRKGNSSWKWEFKYVWYKRLYRICSSRCIAIRVCGECDMLSRRVASCHCHVLSGAIVRGRLGGQLVISRINTCFSCTYFSHDAFNFVAQNWEGFVCGHILA